MIVTLQHFSRALLTPDLSLATLADARPVTDPTAYRAWCARRVSPRRKSNGGASGWLVAMPLNPSAMPRIERTVSALRKLNTGYLAECRILPGEMRWHDATARNGTQTWYCSTCLRGGSSPKRCSPRIRRRCSRRSIHCRRRSGSWNSHTTTSRKRTSAGTGDGSSRYAITMPASARRSSARVTGRHSPALRHRIAKAPAPRQTANDVTAHYNPLRSLTGHRWTSHVFEGLVCVEDDNGFGFVDTDNNPVIPAQFVWAGDFREGRAEVQTQTGMGLIDRPGAVTSYLPNTKSSTTTPAASVVHVRNNGHWALFDYLGRRLTEFRTEVPGALRA